MTGGGEVQQSAELAACTACGEPAQPGNFGCDCCPKCNHPKAEQAGLADLTRRDRLDLWWINFRRRWRRCPECGQLGYGNKGPGPGKTYRWVDDPIVKACGFETAPHRCNTCGQTPRTSPAGDAS